MASPQTSGSPHATVRAPTALEIRRRLQADHAALGQDAPASRAETRAVAWVDDYVSAERAVDLLVARGFPVEHLCISGEGLRLVEEVTGRLTYSYVALRGLVGGTLLGILLGVGFGFLGLTDPIVSAAVIVGLAAVVGGVAGMLVSSIGRWLEEGRRDFISRTKLEAGRFGVFCDVDYASQAEELLGPMISGSPSSVGST